MSANHDCLGLVLWSQKVEMAYSMCSSCYINPDTAQIYAHTWSCIVTFIFLHIAQPILKTASMMKFDMKNLICMWYSKYTFRLSVQHCAMVFDEGGRVRR